MKFDTARCCDGQPIQEELAHDESAKEVVETSAGCDEDCERERRRRGGLHDLPRAIDPHDSELLADMVLAAVREALRGRALSSRR